MIRQFVQKLKNDPQRSATAIAFIVVIVVMMAFMISQAGGILEDALDTYHDEVMPGTPVSERLEGAIDAVEKQVDDRVAFKDAFNELFGTAHAFMNKKTIRDYNYGSLYKTKYGQITYKVKRKNMTEYIRNISELAGRIEGAGIPFVYVTAPFKLPADEQQLPPSYVDYSNLNNDIFIEKITERGIKSFDLRPLMRESGLSQNELFFNTDHHWTIPAAFYATGRLEEYLNETFGFGIDEKYRDPANYTFTTYEKSYIGSMGRRVGRVYGGVDDFTLVTPDFETNITLSETDYGATTVYEGSFEDSVLKLEEYIEPKELTTNRYAVYHGDNTVLVFKNNLVDNGKKILMIKDSFGIPVYSFLSLGVSEVCAIDMRLFEEDAASFAIEYDPDVVLVFYNSDSLSRDMFRFKEKDLY